MKQMLLGVFLIMAVLIPPGNTQAGPPPSKGSQEPIIIALNNWSSQIVLSRILGHLYGQMGYRVFYHTVSLSEQWGALARGLVHVQVEVWEGTMARMFFRMIQEGSIVDAGSYPVNTREEWWYPAYVESLCPGLPHWEALKRCASLFAVPETWPKGRYLAGPWEKPDEARIRSLGLNFQAVQVRESSELWVELDKAVQNQTPIVLFNWTPNGVDAVYEGKFVEFPDYEPECETDAAWGVNPNHVNDCGNPKNGWLKKAAWSGMASKWPGSLHVLENLSLDNTMFSHLTAMVVVDKMSYEEAALKWILENRELWESWIPTDFIKGGSLD
jgi:glycine betaine/proline transport system substrate-binding protein